ncbi:glycosyltransferase [Desulfuromonas sp. CSMB_57]|uniref:glycosyltransferase n=1 Tax=Desulfuromonas sp. CSMB_57 TaxID=2807629 RepID=UPI001CD7D2A5
MRILIVIPRQPRTTGNWVAACRQQTGLQALGHTVRIVEVAEPGEGLEKTVAGFAPDVVNLLHAYRSGKPWLACHSAYHIPLAVTLTGTDVNHDLNSPQERTIILQVLAAAGAIITIHPVTCQALALEFPDWSAKLHHVPPAVTFEGEYFDLRGRLKIPREAVLFLHPAGVRPVKGNLELLLMFDRVVRAKRCRLVFCGPILDADYSMSFFRALRGRPWALYAGEVPVAAMPSVMQAADVVLNNSCSEGFSSVLQEAAGLGVPVLARDIPGNRGAFEPGCQGWLYGSAQDFVRQAVGLAKHPGWRRRLSRPTPTVRSRLEEALQLEHIYRRLLAAPARPCLPSTFSDRDDNRFSPCGVGHGREWGATS